MSCCNSTPTKVIIQCGTESTAELNVTATNDNLTGVGVLDSQTSTTLGFRGIASSGGTIAVTHDSTNKTVNVEVDENILAGNFPDATTTTKGKVELGTDAEAQAKTSTTVVLTPSNLASLGGSTSFAGLLELATNAETQTGTDTARAVTPAGLKSVTDTLSTLTTFANAGARATAVPTFAGQVGIQIDTLTPYTAYGTNAGEWRANILTVNTTNVLYGDTTIDLESGDFIITDSQGSGNSMQFFDGGILNMTASGRLHINNVAVPANSVIMSSVTAGQATSVDAGTNFLSTFSTQQTWTITGNSTLRTFDPTTATTEILGNVLATLLGDLSAIIRPSIAA